jgi:MATE family multidrug resistance protein
VVALSGLLNLVFDYMFIFVLGGGMAGAAWASVAAQYTGAALFCYMVYRKRSSLGLQAALEGPHKRAMAAASSSAERSALALASHWRRLQLLLADLNWLGFCKQAAALTLRGVLILSTYTGASMVAAKLGTAQIAGHQVVQQLQQLQLNVAWAFLNVGQSMVANVFHLPNGTKMARKVADRIIAWGIAAGVVMAATTWSLRAVLPGLFVQDVGVLALVASAVLPACVMLALSFNNALEGCLIGAGDSLFVVNVYPWAVTFCMAVLALAYFSGAGLGGLWWAMVVYYAALVTMFSARYWVKSFRGKL